MTEQKVTKQCPYCSQEQGERHLIGCPKEVEIFVKGGNMKVTKARGEKCPHIFKKTNDTHSKSEFYCPDCHLCMEIDKNTKIGRKWYEITT